MEFLIYSLSLARVRNWACLSLFSVINTTHCASMKLLAGRSNSGMTFQEVLVALLLLAVFCAAIFELNVVCLRYTGTINMEPGVHPQVFFNGNISVKVRDIVNETGIAGNLQFYGISPTDPATAQSINIAPPGNFPPYFMRQVPITTSMATLTSLVRLFAKVLWQWQYERPL
jgi:hypothetical protein